VKSAVILAPALALGVLAVPPAGAQEHKATRLGNPATRFAKPIKKADELRVLLRAEKMKADVAAMLNEWGWKGNLEDLDRAAAAAEISEVKVAPGTRLPFMASRKNKRPRLLRDVLWAGKKPIDAFAFEFASNCVRYRLVAPKVCSNFWVEDLGKDTTDPKCAPPPPAPVVSLSTTGSVCVTQPVDITVNVQNPPADGKVVLTVKGQTVASGTLSAGSYKATLPGTRDPGRYDVTAAVGGKSATAAYEVRPCPPTCVIAVTTVPVKKGKPFTVTTAESRVAPGVTGGIKSAAVEVVREGAVVDKFTLTAPNLSKADVVVKKKGPYTVRAVVTDDAGQTSANACETQFTPEFPALPIFGGIYGGKERLVHDSGPGSPGGRCAGLIGAEIGVQPLIGDNVELEVAVGGKINARDSENSSIFGDLAINRVLGGGFVGAGLSAWDLTRSNGSRAVALLVQGGFDLTKDGKWQLVGQARAPFNKFDDLDNNYQVWGGFRFRPNSSK
jgi:hypothetical protein